MKKVAVLLICFICLLGMCSCHRETSSPQSYLSVDFPEIQKYSQTIYYIAWGNFSEQPAFRPAMIFADNRADSRQVEVFLAVETPTDAIVCSLGLFDENVIPSGSLYTLDVDADGVDEIVYSGECTGNGATISRVYRIANGSLQLMLDANQYAGLDGAAYGYSYAYLAGKKLKVENISVGFSAEQDISAFFGSDYFDSDGIPKVQTQVFFSGADARLTVGRMSDNELCLKHMQYVKGDDLFGSIVTTLKYDANERSFYVAEAKYIPYGYFGWERLLPHSKWTYIEG